MVTMPDSSAYLQRMEMDSANTTAPTSEVQPPRPQLPQAVQQLPVVQPLVLLSTNASQFIEGSAAELHPPPTFDGSPEDWPLFFENYVDTTASSAITIGKTSCGCRKRCKAMPNGRLCLC
ncbi:PREDICTED: uncharacterized protein LOC108369371 [Rhagoletis zephyria]|uniref:uncharacterized protein LOC108369371 n=1 Tax=Rhagoletis zephyria TaxID=28612 RepID=UPI0008112291|nr:PREDICTED: uncharacterized protein LOC108369371 [Rhagoletis zephyria]